jgi:hypothetical protein
MIKYLKLHSFDGKATVSESVEKLYNQIETKGFSAFFTNESILGNLCIPRKQELYATINRCRELIHID